MTKRAPSSESTETLRYLTRAMVTNGPVAQMKHFFVIDLSRGVAATAVLVWHYMLFFAPAATTGPSFPGRENLPFYGIFFPFYEHGHAAVQLFWMISGFVFAHVYPSRVITTRAFLASRFARLYPLHLLTLVAVAVLQTIHYGRHGAFQAFEHNDIYHFALNIFFASNWGLERGLSFNAPVWSVSVEVLVYAVFWLLLPYLFRFGVLGPLLVSSVFYGLVILGMAGTFWTCGAYFFGGAAIYRIHASTPTKIQYGIALALVIGSTSLRLLTYKTGAAQFLLFSAALLVLAALENSVLASFARSLRWIGDCTYGIYLLHVPVVLGILLVIDMDTPRGQGLFLFYFAIVILLARISHIFFEQPCRIYLHRFIKLQ
jgi:peptidoglycan/LPS O-acetylase OafA/YrhL